MKNAVKIGIMIFFILVVVRSSYSQYLVSGTVRYSDNNQTLSTGRVKAYRPNGTLIATTNIEINGTYSFPSLPGEQIDIFGLVSDEEADNFIPTYYPDKLNPSMATVITPTSDMYNIDIYVIRLVGGHSAFGTSIAGNITLDNKPVENDGVYAKK